MKKAKDVRDVREIQKELAAVVEDVAAIRRRLRLLQKETEQTPGYRLSRRAEFGEPDESQETLGWILVGVIAEAIGNLDELAYSLLHAKRMEWTEADRRSQRVIGLMGSIKENA